MGIRLRRLRAATFLLGLMLSVGSAFAQATFDRAAQAVRYRAWLAQFEQDAQQYKEELQEGTASTDEDVARIFKRTVVPGSRGILNVRTLFGGITNGQISYGEVGRTALYFLNASVPAGYGGAFPETDSKYTKGASVWYMHIDYNYLLQEDYFENPAIFDQYQLPPNGVLKRKAYPFLMFDDREQELKFSGFSQEYWGAVQYLWNSRGW